ncbi:enolase-phosphatase E1-like isoform X2 [Periplaneta americana]
MTSGAVRKHKEKKVKRTHTHGKKKKKRRLSKATHEETKARENVCEEEIGGGTMDLSEEIHPIGYYINDKAEMVNQMFSVIKESKLRAMLPPALKDCSIEELKSYCLEELLGMSMKRIQSILEGRELEISSESDEANANAEHENVMDTSSGEKSLWSSDEMRFETQDAEENLDDETNRVTNGSGNDMDTLEIGITKKEMGELLNYIPSSKKTEKSERKRHLPASESEPCASTSKKHKSKVSSRKKLKRKSIQEPTTAKISEDKVGHEEKDDDSPGNTEESKGKTLLEILELEMRARAIRALLKQQGEDIESSEAVECSEAFDITPEMSQSVNFQSKESPSLNVITDCGDDAGLCKDKENLTESDICSDKKLSITKLKEKVRRKEIEKVNTNQCKGTTDQSSVSSDVIDKDLVPRSIKSEQCSSRKPNRPRSRKQSESDKHVDRGVNYEDSSQSSFCSAVRIEVIHFTEKEEGNSEWVSTGREAVSSKALVSKAVTMRERDREDGELSSEEEKSSQHVVEVQGDSNDGVIDKIESAKVQDSTEQTDVTQNLSPDCQRQCSNSNGDPLVKDVTSEDVTKEKSLRPCEDSNPTIKTLDEAQEEESLASGNYSEKSDTAGCSWATRWLQSKGVQEVVSTSKMCARIRKRMKFAKSMKQIKTVIEPEENITSSVVIEGSVNEYNMLDKPKTADEVPQDNTPENVVKSLPPENK